MTIGIRESLPPVPKREDALLLIEGVLDRLYVEDESERLVSRIAQQDRDEIARKHTDTDALPDDPIARAADDIERALYFAEDMQYFACLIDGQVVCGEFAGAEKLKPGHRVKAAVSRSGGVLYAHAILDPQQGWLWMHHARGSAADAKAERKLALWLFCLCSVGMAAIIQWASWPAVARQRDPLEVQAWFLIGNAVVFGGMALSARYRMSKPPDANSRILGLLGFTDPHRVDLNRYRIRQLETDKHLRFIAANKNALRSGRMKPEAIPELTRESPDRSRNVHDYRQAIADGKATVRR
ncbi:hypothetical protein [Lysobacter sp. CA199]|uniref:hypothetical protein n=1 Tax=Lysobacter sp. CA199 TaxID=3455608 RepID=UPI003F8D05FE